MSRLKSKLKRRQKKNQAEVPPIPLESGSSSDLVQQLKRRMEKVKNAHRLKPSPNRTGPTQSQRDPLALKGEVVETDEGEVLYFKKIFKPSYRHGRFGAADFLNVGAGLPVLAKDDSLAGFSPLKALFLDTETTGLSGGTGTLPFLIGVGRIQDDGAFVVEQFFCREPGEERAQLHCLSEHLGWASALVTFNGRAFDMPLVNTRFILQQMKNPGYALPHLDLLHIARRVFRRRLESCSLGALESAILGFERVGDIPGHAIPAAYASYLKGGPQEPMERVLEHNALDLVGLAALGALLEEMYQDPAKVAHAADHLGLAKAALNAGEQTTAISHLNRASSATEKVDSVEAYLLVVRSFAKQGEFDRARAMLEKALGQWPEDAALHLTLAKHLEHRDKDFETALEHARFTGPAEGEAQSSHRMARLERRLARQRTTQRSSR